MTRYRVTPVIDQSARRLALERTTSTGLKAPSYFWTFVAYVDNVEEAQRLVDHLEQPSVDVTPTGHGPDKAELA